MSNTNNYTPMYCDNPYTHEFQPPQYYQEQVPILNEQIYTVQPQPIVQGYDYTGIICVFILTFLSIGGLLMIWITKF